MRNIHKALIAVGAAIVLSLAMAGPVLAETPAPTPAPTETTQPTLPDTYVIVAWSMPTKPVNATTPSWPQAIFSHAVEVKPDLTVLDGQLTKCGTYYQVDIYVENATTDALIAGGVLTSPNHPAESLIPGGWNVAYKLVINADCVVVTPPPTTPPVVTPPVVTPPHAAPPTTPTLAETGTVPVGGILFATIAILAGLAAVVGRILFDRKKPRF